LNGRFSRTVVVAGVLAVTAILGAGAYAFGAVLDRPAQRAGAAAQTGVSESPSGTASPSPVATESAQSGLPASSPPGSPPASSAPPPPPAGCKQGPAQAEVETLLVRLSGFGPVGADGVQSAEDCTAIKKFQQRYGLSPADGVAGNATVGVARRLAASIDPAEQAKCQGGAGMTACVNLSLQTVWLLRDGQLVYGPTVVRTGFRGYTTPAGKFKIDRRNRNEWSIKYKVNLPYFQHFYAGMGFHEVTNYIHNPGGGSHGCLNLLRPDAVHFWNALSVGSTIHSFGRRPGT